MRLTLHPLYARTVLHSAAMMLIATGVGLEILSFLTKRETPPQRYRRHLKKVGKHVPHLPQKLHEIRSAYH